MTEISARDRRLARKARAAKMVEMYRAGKTLREIGSEYGVTRESVRQEMTRYFGIRAKDGGAHISALARLATVAADKDARYVKKYGCTRERYIEIRDAGGLKPFTQQKVSARKRGIDWRFTLPEWWAVWQKSGKWARRGRGAYCMCRIGDVGPYAPHNVFIATSSTNIIYGAHLRRTAAIEAHP